MNRKLPKYQIINCFFLSKLWHRNCC